MKGRELKRRLMMKKTLHIPSIVLALVLVTDATPPTGADRVVPEIGQNHEVYASVAESQSARCFDEALWKAISNVADIEEQLPSNLTAIEVEIRPANYVAMSLRLVFAREALQSLKEGKVTPERFLREYVQFI